MLPNRAAVRVSLVADLGRGAGYRSRTRCPSNAADPQVKSFAFLEVTDDLKRVPGLGVAVGAEHTHQALRRLAVNAPSS